jgi:serine/threonine protein kinase
VSKPSSRCSICEKDLPDLAAQGGAAASEILAGGQAVCDVCHEKLASRAATSRTTIMRPVGALNVDGKAVVPPLLQPHEAAEGQPESGSSITVLPEGAPTAADVPPESECLAGADAGAGPVHKKFGTYEILHEISRGSFGVVYKAKQQGLDRVVALKVLLAGVHASAEAVGRFQREAKSVARLKHPHIVPVYDFGMHEGHHYFAMEFIEGHPLSTLISRQQVSISDALMIGEALSDALETAHAAGVIHRDVKPSNVLIDRDGRPHITDFGLAKQVDIDTKYTVSGTTLGTPAYMPPEQARGEVERIDARSDVYSIGAVLYEMLTGRTPFVGRSMLEVVVAVINDPLKPPRQLNPRIHRDIQTIVQKCLEKDPRQRYASAAELRDDLRRFRSGETIRAKPAGALRLAGRFIKRQTPLVAACSVVLSAIIYSYARVEKSKQQVEKSKLQVEESREKTRQLQAEKRELEKLDQKRKQAEWKPDWWFPRKAASNLSYAVPDEEQKYFDGLIEYRGRYWDMDEAGRLQEVVNVRSLASPAERRFVGDIEGEMVFDLDEEAARAGVRIGLQSVEAQRDFDGIPLLFELKKGKARLIGPGDLFAYTHPRGGARPRLRLEVKAEMDAAQLTPGRYTLRFRREGLQLKFQLSWPAPSVSVAKIEIRDLCLSDWVFKNMRLVARQPHPGFAAVAAEVRHKTGGDEDPAFRDFRLGDHYNAERDLQALAAGDDSYKKARALLCLGSIKEVYEPASPRAAALYTDAKVALDMVRDPQLQDEQRALRQELCLRRLVGFARNKQWDALMEELSQGWPGEKIGEPLVWELQGVIEQALLAPDIGTRLDAGLALFKSLGVAPGCSRLDNAARSLGLMQAVEGRLDDLIALQSSYPGDLYFDAFCDLIQREAKSGQLPNALRAVIHLAPRTRGDAQTAKLHDAATALAVAALKSRRYADVARVFQTVESLKASPVFLAELALHEKELAGPDFNEFCAVLLPVFSNRQIENPDLASKFNKCIERVGQGLIGGGNAASLIRLHEALRGPRMASDSRLAGVFAAAVRLLGCSGDPALETVALELLAYCGEHVTLGDENLQAATLAFAQRKAIVDDLRTYVMILSIQQAYPAPELLRLSNTVLLELLKRGSFEQASLFYSNARVAFRGDGARLTPALISVLSHVNLEEQRVSLLKSVSDTVRAEFARQKEDGLDRNWTLEHGDILLALNYPEKAREQYVAAHAAKADVMLSAKAALRLAAMQIVNRKESAAPADYFNGMDLAELPEELRIAVQLIASPDAVHGQELAALLKKANAPSILSEAEWDFLRGVRFQMDQNVVGALSALEDAARKSSESRAWVHMLASQLLRPHPRPLDPK